MIDPFKLHFGPYETPAFNYGDVVEDERRGTVEIVGVTNARIPWPIGRPLEKGLRRQHAIILFSGLSAAVFAESSKAICHWWGVAPHTVWKWRKALDVEKRTEGDLLLSSANYKDHVGAVMRQAALPTLSSPERRAKISRAKIGKARPDVVRRNRQRIGSKLSEETREKMRAAYRRRLAVAVAQGKYRPWTAEEDNLVRSLPPSEVSRRIRRTRSSIYHRRHKLKSNDKN